MNVNMKVCAEYLVELNIHRYCYSNFSLVYVDISSQSARAHACKPPTEPPCC